VFSTLKSESGKIRLGDILAGWVRQLRTGKWLDLETLLAVDYQSPLYNEKQKSGAFYAESWALAHMLYLSNDYRGKFGEFLSQVKPDSSQRAVFQQVYGKSLSQVQSDLAVYLSGAEFNAMLADVKVEKSAELPEVRAATKVESGLALADLLAVTRKREEARAAYETLAHENPEDPEIELAWARLAWLNRDDDGVKRHFARAIELGTTNGRVYFDYAMMLREGGAKEPEISALLSKAVQLKPDLAEAHYMLGFYASNAGRFGEAVVHLQQVKSLEQGQAFPYFRTLAYAYYRLGRLEDAKKYAERAVKSATEPQDVDLAKELLAYVMGEPAKTDAPRRLVRRDTAGLERSIPLEGTLQQVDCLGGQARLHVEVAGKQMVFLIQDPSRVTVRSSNQEGGYKFICGPQQPVKIALEYLPSADSKLGADGVVRSMDFR
jgi:Flp pilus assembly protein TadD